MKKTNKLITWAISLAVAASGFVAYTAPAQATTSYDVEGLSLDFDNDSPLGGQATEGWTRRYENVITIDGQQIDAIVSAVNTVGLDDDDDSSDGADNLIGAVDDCCGQDLSPWINVYDDDSEDFGSLTLRVEFVLAGTNTPVELQNVSIYVTDIDGGQFAEFSGPGSYELSTETELTVLTHTDDSSIDNGTIRFAEQNFYESDSEDEPFWAAVKYGSLTSVDITVGAIDDGGASYGINFAAPEFSESNVTTPAPTAYTISYNGNGNTSGSAPASTTGTGNLTVASGSGTLKRTGYAFAGWNTNPEGTGATLALGSSYKPTRDITLYAMWNVAPQAEQVKLSKIIYFNSASGAITKAARAQLRALVAQAKALDSITDVSVYGYVQPTKNNAADLSLSRLRAKNTAAVLKKLGIATINDAVGMGKAINKSATKSRYVKIVIRGTRAANPA